MKGDGSTLDVVKNETAAFFDADGKLQIPAGYKVTFDPKEIEKTKLETGTLTIQKNTDTTFTVKLDRNIPIDALTITYINEKEYADARKIAEAIPANRETKTEIAATDIENTFKMTTKISDVFIEKTEKALSVFDIHKNTLYKNFMESVVDVPL